jgi:excisionase family DNA binding protein
MNCAEFAEAKHDLLDERLPEETAREARAHAQGCAACRSDLQSLQRLLAALEGAAADELPRAARTRVMGALLAAAQGAPEIMTLPEVAAYLRVSEATVRSALDRIPHFDVGGELRFRRAGLDRWIEREEQQPARSGITGPVLTLISADAIPGALAG